MSGDAVGGRNPFPLHPPKPCLNGKKNTSPVWLSPVQCVWEGQTEIEGNRQIEVEEVGKRGQSGKGRQGGAVWYGEGMQRDRQRGLKKARKTESKRG